MSDLAKMIREKRVREGLSLREAGEASGVAFSTLGRIENGGEPTFKVAQQIEAWLRGEAPVLPPPPMTLRDWFAGQAPQIPEGFSHPEYPETYILHDEWTQEKQDAVCAEVNKWLAARAAAWAGCYADAMLAERAKAGPAMTHPTNDNHRTKCGYCEDIVTGPCAHPRCPVKEARK